MEELQFKIALVGPENSGKSSLVNSIFGKNISEVSEVGGTTKMPVKKFWGKIKIGKQKINPDFAKITFVDLGGLYAGENRSVVMVGSVLEKTYEEIDDSDLIIHIIDGSTELFKSFEKLHHLLKFRYRKPIIVVINKCDLIENSKREDLRKYVEGRLENKVFFTSSTTYEGIGELLSTVIEILRR
ncbi:Era-like GTP-binding protein [Methanococcus sp. CF]